MVSTVMLMNLLTKKKGDNATIMKKEPPLRGVWFFFCILDIAFCVVKNVEHKMLDNDKVLWYYNAKQRRLLRISRKGVNYNGIKE